MKQGGTSNITAATRRALNWSSAQTQGCGNDHRLPHIPAAIAKGDQQ